MLHWLLSPVDLVSIVSRAQLCGVSYKLTNYLFERTLKVTRMHQSQSQSYFTVSMSWGRAQFGTFDQRYYYFFFKVTVLSYLGRPL
jgi:hypothetical protein